MDTNQHIRTKFKTLKEMGKIRDGTIEIQNAQFRVTDKALFGKRNEEYIKAEIQWYEEESLSVHRLFELYGREVSIWADICDYNGNINSNYGWAVYSQENGKQYEFVRKDLKAHPTSRRAVMYYTRPTMHIDQFSQGMVDHMCTTHVQYFVNDGSLDASVYMRSNDAVFGFTNDVAWQQHVLEKLARDTGYNVGEIIWNAGSLHVYKRHWDLI